MLPSLAKLDLKPRDQPMHTGAGEAKRQKVSLQDVLDRNGCAAVPIPTEKIDAEKFIRDVEQGTHDWFQARLRSALSPAAEVPEIKTSKKADPEKMAKWSLGRDTFAALKDETKRALYVRFDLHTKQGRNTLFLAAERKKSLRGFANTAFDVENEQLSDALFYYLEDRVKYVKQGDSRMGLSAMYKSWSQTGFGKWAHITPGVGLRASLALRERLLRNNIETQLSGGSHMIYKPPGGKELPAHTDGPRPATIITLLKAFEESNGRFPTTSEWMQDQGVQSLVHFDGGDVDGYTYAIGPMTPKKLYHCLKAVQDGSIKATDDELFGAKKKKTKTDDDEEEDEEDDQEGAGAAAMQTARMRFLTGGTGPSFMRWKENIHKFNAVLAKHDEGPIKEMPIRPGEDSRDGAFVALWANGFPHGSAPNKDRRITTTASLAVVGPNYKARDERVPSRVQALATIASLESTDEARAEARALISSDTEPFYGGKTHMHPQHAGTWFDPDMLSNGTGGFYRSIAPTLEDARVFATEWAEGDPSLAPLPSDWERYFVAKETNPGRPIRRPRFGPREK
jgi:hypothetical protein